MQVPALDQELLIIIGVIAAVVVVALVVLAVMAVRRRKERERLKERFGPEYDQAVESEGRRKATEDLHSRMDKRKEFSPVDPDERTRTELRRRMAALQYRFVDDPADVMLETQRAVIDALRACGYPVADDRERALKLLSVDHPEITPPLRTLLEGSYGRDVGRMHTLFDAAKSALRDVAHVGYSQDDLQAGEPAAVAAPAGEGNGAATTRERPDPATHRETATAPDRAEHAAPREPARDEHAAPREPARDEHAAPREPARDEHARAAPREPARDESARAAPREPTRDESARAAPREPTRDESARAAPREPARDEHAAPRD